ncbi:bile acid cotransporter 7 [Seminavis robusta]|uniref:Bile acid cotransporter 7 n=1 Tax=Seminavis robusta TaxID=568900 RepID=A0A9N8HHW5_9STRA|nr:bile acid cotransporter 7 [Seminavis robusta]|eukprot:Sro559_g166490.1 bile acid cotransporter 7 (340) ;mRNA; f:39133-40551
MQLRGGGIGTAGATTNDNGETTNPTALSILAQQWCQFASKNFFLLGMFVAVGLARAFPLLGRSGGVLRAELFIGKFGVACIFLLSGLVIGAVRVEASSFQSQTQHIRLTDHLWPLASLVNMCVILTTAAGGSVATALWNAVISNLAGIFVTPILLLRFFGKYIQLPFIDMIVKLCSQVLLPVAAGQTLRHFGGKEIYKKNAKFFKRLQEVILLGIVWNAFCNTFAGSGLGLELRHALTLSILIPAMHLLSLGVLFRTFSLPIFKFTRREVVAAMFTASQKTLAFGLPLINTIFEGAPNVAAYCTPLMFVHPLQLILGSLCVPRLSKYVEEGDEEAKIVT